MPQNGHSPDVHSRREASLRSGFLAPRLLRFFVLLGGLAATPLLAAADPPIPSDPAQAVALLKWCWENRDIARYRELFTDDFRFAFAPGDDAGNPYPDHAWGRDDELASAAALFGGGSATQPAVTSIALSFGANPQAQPDARPGKAYPWHQQVSLPVALDLVRADGSMLHVAGEAVYFVVRGDSAAIPQELADRGFTADPDHWYFERWEEGAGTGGDHPPVVTAPSIVNARVGTLVMIDVTAQDPDGDPITSFTVQGAPLALFTTGPGRTTGTLSWRTTSSNLGTYPLVFTAGNVLTGAATTTLNVLPADLPPVASLSVTAIAGTEPLDVTADGSASHDPDGTIVVYRFDFGDGTASVFQTTATATHMYRAGTWTLTLTVTDDEGASRSTSATIVVSPASVPPIPSLVVTPTSGAEPLIVTADASGSTDPGGVIVSYCFAFGDGALEIQATPIVAHSYRAGSWYLMLTVTDDNGISRSTTAKITVQPGATEQENLVSNPSFELGTGGWRGYAGAAIERVSGGLDGSYGLEVMGPAVIAGSFGVNDSPDWIRPTPAAGMRYRFSAWVRSGNGHGKARLRVTEYSMATKAKLGLVTSVGVTLSPGWQQVQVDYTALAAGSTLDFQVRDFPLVAGEVFVTDDISIRDITGVTGIVPAEGEADLPEEQDPAALEPALHPSPVRSAAVLSFATSRPGALRVEVIDLAGRRVQRVADEIDSPPGMHVLKISGIGDDGRRMSPGVYFYRIEAEEGARTGRFVMLK